MVKSCASLATALVLAGTAPALAAFEFTHEGWKGQVAFTDGKFRQCLMWASAINNFDVGFSLDGAGELRLGLRSTRLDQTWPMIFNMKTALRIQLDQGPVLIKAFTSVSPTLLSTSLKGTDWEKRLPDADLLRINTGTRVRQFHLTGIKAAMDKLRACAAKHRAA
ncbi:MAG: hypothetical protein QOH67_2133 [Hyphomicrobiales bacterium]|jgi:hypothetical protein|nr:hypothetical protein [Hyphomicrobiales bacterium]